MTKVKKKPDLMAIIIKLQSDLIATNQHLLVLQQRVMRLENPSCTPNPLPVTPFHPHSNPMITD